MKMRKNKAETDQGNPSSRPLVRDRKISFLTLSVRSIFKVGSMGLTINNLAELTPRFWSNSRILRMTSGQDQPRRFLASAGAPWPYLAIMLEMNENHTSLGSQTDLIDSKALLSACPCLIMRYSPRKAVTRMLAAQ